MSIHILTGLPGHGKTVALTAKALEFLDEGVDVYSNYWIDSTSEHLKRWDLLSQLNDIKEGVILLDEAQVYFNSRVYAKLPLSLQYKLQQHRKQGLHIWGTVQNLQRLDLVMRELVSNFYVCKMIFRLPLFLTAFLARFMKKFDREKRYAIYKIQEYEPSDANKKVRQGLTNRWYLGQFRPEESSAALPDSLTRAYGRYDTLREVELPKDSTYRTTDTMSSANASSSRPRSRSERSQD